MDNRHSSIQEHIRTQFQIDRIAFFSDAVIAIAITLMVLEIKIPSFGEHTTLKEILSKYGWLISVHLAALFLSFITIGNLWIRHHELYEHIINYDKRLIKVNLYFLMTIMFLPISISFLFSTNNPPQLRMILYFMNLGLCNLTYYLMLLVVYHRKKNFSAIAATEKTAKNKRMVLGAAIVFVLVSVLVAFNVNWFYYPFIGWWFFRRIWEGIVKWRKKSAQD
ncbi:MAG TPA: TMEM175 family protein [Puia sp.]|nr:TMEM175 family protein [Puia sp.]